MEHAVVPRGTHHREIHQRLVDVGDEHRDLELATFVEVDRRLVLVALDAGEQSRKIFAGMVGLEVGGLERDESVPDRVGLVERVVGEGLDVSNICSPNSRGMPWVTHPSTNFVRSLARSSRFFLPVALRRLSASSSEYPASCCYHISCPGTPSTRTSARGPPRASGCGYVIGFRPFFRSAYSLCQFWAIGPGR